MLYVALIPSYAWVALLVSAWGVLAYWAHALFGFRNHPMTALVVVMGLQAIVASSVALATSNGAIDYYPCRVGAWGAMATPAIAAAEALVLFHLAGRWPADVAGARRQFRGWLATWLLFGVIVLLAHLRSATLCTV